MDKTDGKDEKEDIYGIDKLLEGLDFSESEKIERADLMTRLEFVSDQLEKKGHDQEKIQKVVEEMIKMYEAKELILLPMD